MDNFKISAYSKLSKKRIGKMRFKSTAKTERGVLSIFSRKAKEVELDGENEFVIYTGIGYPGKDVAVAYVGMGRWKDDKLVMEKKKSWVVKDGKKNVEWMMNECKIFLLKVLEEG